MNNRKRGERKNIMNGMKTTAGENAGWNWRGLTAALALALALAPMSPAWAQDAEADEAALLEKLKGLVNEVSGTAVERLSALREADELNPEAAREVIREVASPHFNFAGLARGALGKHWRKADEEQRKQVADLFRSVLEKAYAKALSTYAGQVAETVGAAALSEDKISVEVKVSAGETDARIDYIFSPSKDDGEWLVSDVKVEGISLSRNYRKQFSGIIRKHGVDGLIEKLTERAK